MSVIHLERPKPRRTRKLAAPKAPGERVTRRGRRSHFVAASGESRVGKSLDVWKRFGEAIGK